MKTIKKSVMIPLAKIHKNLFVRQELDQERVLELAELLEADQKTVKGGGNSEVKIPPIVVTPLHKVGSGGRLEYCETTDEFDNVDGRHRVEAAALAGLEEIEATVVTFETKAEFIAEAYRANAGGSKPPTKEDTEHVIKQLIEENVGFKRIAENLGLPFSIVRSYVENVRSKVQRQKLVAAINDVAGGGMTVGDAAVKHGVDEDKVRESISGRGRRRKNEIADLERNLSNKYRAFTPTINATFKKLLKKVEDADISVKTAMKIFARVEKLQKRAVRNTEDWKARFVAAAKNGAAESKE